MCRFRRPQCGRRKCGRKCRVVSRVRRIGLPLALSSEYSFLLCNLKKSVWCAYDSRKIYVIKSVTAAGALILLRILYETFVSAISRRRLPVLFPFLPRKSRNRSSVRRSRIEKARRRRFRRGLSLSRLGETREGLCAALEGRAA